MAEYLVLIYGDEAAYAGSGPQGMEDMHKAHNDFGTTNAAALRGGNALQPASTATTIRGGRTDSVTVTDGPFAETKEVLGGYYLIEAPDLDAAIEIAKQVPAPFGGVEVRPVLVFD
jgi:hypothetical protein